ncbi:MAG: hypothetical protein AAF561_10470 [Planctomycetota bacterium]
MTRLIACVFTLLLALPTVASAWSSKEHVLMTRLAAQRILADEDAPAGLKAFVRKHCPEAEDFDLHDFIMNVHVGPRPEGYEGLAYWAMHPDFDRSTPVPAFNSTEGKMHYINLELFNKDPKKRRYFDDLSGLPDLSDIPRDPDDPRFAEAGYLPFRVEQCYNELVKAFAVGNDEAAVRWAGYLAHYLQDNTQPHNATVDFRSHSYFLNVRDNLRPNVHGWMEHGFLDEAQPPTWLELRLNFINSLEDELARAVAFTEYDFFRADVARISKASSMVCYGYLPSIGTSARLTYDSRGDLKTFALDESRDVGHSPLLIKTRLQAMAISTLEAAWRQAWAESQGEYERPADQRTAKLTTRPARLPGSE